jgi:hypothetical protein
MSPAGYLMRQPYFTTNTVQSTTPACFKNPGNAAEIMVFHAITDAFLTAVATVPQAQPQHGIECQSSISLVRKESNSRHANALFAGHPRELLRANPAACGKPYIRRGWYRKHTGIFYKGHGGKANITSVSVGARMAACAASSFGGGCQTNFAISPSGALVPVCTR